VIHSIASLVSYHYVDIIHKVTWKFSRGKKADRIFYKFTVLPFGLAIACYVFIKVLSSLVKQWKGMAMKVIVDDGICSAKSSQGALHAKSILLDDLDQAGLVLYVPKSQLEPIQCGLWLGFLIIESVDSICRDSADMQYIQTKF